MLGRILIALAIGGFVPCAMAAEVQVFGFHVPATGTWGVYARISDASLNNPSGGLTQTAGIQSISVQLQNNSTVSPSATITKGTVKTTLPGGMTNVQDPDTSPDNLGTLGYGFWLAHVNGGDVQYQYTNPNDTTSAITGVTVGDAQFSLYDAADPNLSVYKSKILQTVGISAGSQALGGQFVSDFRGSTTATNWTQPVLVASGKYTPSITDTTQGPKIPSASVNVIRDLDGAGRLESAATKVVDPKTLKNAIPAVATGTVRVGAGDGNMDGITNFSDLVLVAQNYNTPGTWFSGDYNFDGMVGFADLVLVAQNYNVVSGGSAADFETDVARAFGQTVPEPAVISSIILLSSLLTFGRFRRQWKS